MDTFGWVILIFSIGEGSLYDVPRAPYIKHFGLEQIRDDIFALSSNGIRNIVPLPKATIRFPVEDETSIQSKAPQLFHHMVINGQHVTAPLIKADRKEDVKQYEHKEDTKHAGGSYHNKEGNAKGGGDQYNHHVGGKGSKQNKHHYHDSGKQGDSGKEEKKKSYGEESGFKKSHDDGDKHGGSHHNEQGGGHKSAFNKNAHKGDKHASKGYHDLHHKDEKKNLDSFYTNGHEEGKWIHFGKSNHKHGNEGYEKKNGKWQKKSKEQSENKNEKQNKKETGSKSHEKHGSKGSEGHAYNNQKEYSDAKSSKDAKTYNIKQ